MLGSSRNVQPIAKSIPGMAIGEQNQRPYHITPGKIGPFSEPGKQDGNAD